MLLRLASSNTTTVIKGGKSLFSKPQISKRGRQKIGRDRRRKWKEVRREPRVFRLADRSFGGLERRHNGDLSQRQCQYLFEGFGAELVWTRGKIWLERKRLTGGAILIDTQ